MITSMRRHMKWMLIALVILIVPAFVLWGTRRGSGRRERPNRVMGRMYGGAVRLRTLQAQYDAVIEHLRWFRMLLLSRPYREPGYESYRFRRLMFIEQARRVESVLRQRLQDADLELVSAATVTSLIEGDESFKDPETGEFDRSRYEAFLEREGMTAEEFEQQLRENLMADWMVSRLLSDEGYEEQVTLAWQRLVLLREAKRWQIAVSGAEIGTYLAVLFPGPSGFDASLYERYLRNRRIDRALYERTVEDSIRLEKLRSAVGATALVTPQEVRELFDRENETRRIAFHLISVEDMLPAVEVEEGEAEQFYLARRADEFQIAQRARVQYVVAETSAFYDRVPVSDEEIATYYEEHKGDFVVEPVQEAEEAASAAAAGEQTESGKKVKPLRDVKEEIRRRIQRTKEGEAKRLAREQAEKISAIVGAVRMKEKAKDLGLVLRESGLFGEEGPIDNYIGSDEPAFRAAASRTPLGEVSRVVETRMGFAVLSPTQVVPDAAGRVEPFEKVKAQAEEKVRQAKAWEIAVILTRGLRRKVTEYMAKHSVDFEAACAALDLDLKTTKPFTRLDEEIEAAGDMPRLAQFVFMSPEEKEVFGFIGEQAYVFWSEDGALFFDVVESTMPSDEAFEQERNAYRTRLFAQRAPRVYREWLLALWTTAGVERFGEEATRRQAAAARGEAPAQEERE